MPGLDEQSVITAERERLGRIACEAWEEWASEQPSPWPIRRPAWEDCSPGTQESFRRIGEAVAVAEREQCAQLAEQHGAIYPLPPSTPTVTIDGEPAPSTSGNVIIWPEGMPAVGLVACLLREQP